MSNERIHSLDSLRAAMMFLGIVFHAALIFLPIESETWQVHDPKSKNIIFDGISLWIHSFRMPVFFIISGFFAALLFYARTPSTMIKNRIKRIYLPFLACLFTILPLYKFMVFYANKSFELDGYSLIEAIEQVSLSILFPLRVEYFWFLNYLMIMSLMMFLFGIFLSKVNMRLNFLKRIFENLMRHNFISVFVFCLLSFLSLYSMGYSLARTDLYIIPNPSVFLYYFLFFIYGCLLYSSRKLLYVYTESYRVNLILGTVLYVCYITMTYFYKNELFYLEMFCYALIVWLYSFGIIGLFLKCFRKESAMNRYFSDSSYWVYIIHLPIILYITSLIGNYNLSAIAKFTIIVSSTFFISMLSYHYLVRSTFIGQFLNGKKYPFSGRLCSNLARFYHKIEKAKQ
ncbi:acyltransferase family protein [Parashewanella curva]|nr:acyltransferase family protein [Parashewanella curva]